MNKYHDEQLYDILRARVRWGLEQDAVTDDQLYCIADAAAGDARLAIGILRTAAARPTANTTNESPTKYFKSSRGCPSPNQTEESRFAHPSSTGRLRNYP